VSADLETPRPAQWGEVAERSEAGEGLLRFMPEGSGPPPGGGTWMRLLLVTIMALSLGSCTDIPAPAVGGRILGTISYSGSAHKTMKRPVVRVMVVVDFPPTSGPLGFQIIEAGEQPNFPAKVSYELKGIVPYSYKVVAQLVDVADPDAAATKLPLGGYTDFCSLLDPSQGWVLVSQDAPATGIDFTLYDNAGTEDPCNASTSICPQPGKASMNLTVQLAKSATAADRLIFALFTTFPSTSPARTRIVPGAQVTFPQTLLDDAITPGSYGAIYVCFDVGGNSGTGLCTQEDAFLLATPLPPLDFPAGKIVNLVVDLDAHTSSTQGVDDPSALGCP
jgi:hypothetical protein